MLHCYVKKVFNPDHLTESLSRKNRQCQVAQRIFTKSKQIREFYKFSTKIYWVPLEWRALSSVFLASKLVLNKYWMKN